MSHGKHDTSLSNLESVGRLMSVKDMSSFNFLPSSSFRTDPYTGIRSSQQLRIDWSRFENHTFFNSAQVNVNVAFDTIINRFPFDGTRGEIDGFLDSLTGFERYVYDKFSKNIGYLNFSGSYISVQDRAGTKFPSLSRRADGASVLDPGLKSITLEMHVLIATGSNDNQVIIQKTSGSSHGFSLVVSSSTSTTSASLSFIVVSGSLSTSASIDIKKGSFAHVAAVLDRESEENKALMYMNQALVASASSTANFKKFGFSFAPLTIGSGSTIVSAERTFVPKELFSGSIDELRVFHSSRTKRELEIFAKRSLAAEKDFVLYYKFNEPTGTLGQTTASNINKIVIDSSGNSLHSSITGTFDFALRNTSSISVPIKNERLDESPILFPAYKKTVNFNIDVLFSASLYDSQNPNLITRLIPEHYLAEGQSSQGFSSQDGLIINEYTGSSIPGSGKLGAVQTLLTLLYSYGKFFDELKLSIDAVSTLRNVDYLENDTVPDAFLFDLAKYHGFDVKSMFSKASVDQFAIGNDVADSNAGQRSLLRVQNELTRRFLTNIRDIITSKGTLHSVKAFMRTIGVDPDNSLRIREFSGPRRRSLSNERERRSFVAAALRMTASSTFMTSSFLSASRVEVGSPEQAGTFVLKDSFPPHGLSNNSNDGLLTSGSWTVEAVYRYPRDRKLSSVTQSLIRLMTTGSAMSGSSLITPILLGNVVAVTSSNPYVKLLTRVGSGSSDEQLTLMLSGVNVFDGDHWHVSFGRARGDMFGSIASSSYVLRCAKMEPSAVRTRFSTSSFLLETTVGHDVLKTVSAALNTSGAFLAVGSQSIRAGSPNYVALNDISVSGEARATIFDGDVSGIKFWSKAIDNDEWNEHVDNRASVGVNDPRVNFGFTSNLTGSWEKLRMDVNMSQQTTSSDASGALFLTDMSQNGLHMTASGFERDSRAIFKELVSTTHRSHKFDEAVVTNKVRVRGFTDADNVSGSSTAIHGLAHSLDPTQLVDDDPRFSIDLSVVDSLSRDMFNVFGSIDVINDMIGDPTLAFSGDYVDMDHMRNVYFNRLDGSIRFDDFFKLFRWFDSIMSDVVVQLLPRKTKFLGMNFVVEPHVLERSKHVYRWHDLYLNEEDRETLNDIADEKVDEAKL